MCIEKGMGGLGIKNIKLFNLILLGKWWRKIKTRGDKMGQNSRAGPNPPEEM